MKVAESDIEELFIKKALNKHAEFLTDVWIKNIDRLKLVDTGILRNGFRWIVKKESDRWHLKFSFASYGRLMEIMYYKRRRNSIDDLRKNIDLWNLTKRKKNDFKRNNKNTKWYTKTLYGSQYRLINEMLFGLTNTERESIKKELMGYKSYDVEALRTGNDTYHWNVEFDF